MPTTLATIIVVTHESARWLPRQLSALSALTEKRWRLVIVDNASAPNQRPRLADLPPSARLIQSEVNLGFAEANNLGAEEAQTPYLAFLNPDAFPHPDWLTKLLALAESYPAAGAIGSTQLRADAEHLLDGAGDVLHASGLAYRSYHGRPAAKPLRLGESFSACAAAMLARREAFVAVGGFDARYFCYFEDIDLCFRMRLRGWHILQSPKAVVAHVGGGSTGSQTRFAEFHGARNRLWTFVKCMPSPLSWLLLPLHIVATSIVATLDVVRGRGIASWRGLIAGMRSVGPIWMTRREVQRQRTASVQEIARVLAWSPHVLLNRQSVVRPIALHSRKRPD